MNCPYVGSRTHRAVRRCTASWSATAWLATKSRSIAVSTSGGGWTLPELWQMDLMGGVFLADGRECKLVTGIDDCSRFIVIAAVVVQPTGRAVCQAFIEAMRRFGVPSEMLTDNGKQFTGRYSKPLPTEVMFERVCRENGINQRLTKPRSPTTTGKIERFHKTLRREMLDHSGPFADPVAAQSAIDTWVHSYNHTRPHQSLEMATPAQVFRPHSLPAAARRRPREP